MVVCSVPARTRGRCGKDNLVGGERRRPEAGGSHPERRSAPELRPKRQTDLWRPCTPSPPPHEIRTPPPRFRGDPGPGLASAVPGHALEGAPCAPRRRPRIWGTWTPNLSPAFPARALGDRAAAVHERAPGPAEAPAVEVGMRQAARAPDAAGVGAVVVGLVHRLHPHHPGVRPAGPGPHLPGPVGGALPVNAPGP